MINAATIPARNLQKSYRSIISSVKSDKHPVILTTWDKPQAAIVSLEDLAKIQNRKSLEGTLELLKLAINSRNKLQNLPSNLRQKSDDILYSK